MIELLFQPVTLSASEESQPLGGSRASEILRFAQNDSKTLQQ
jgi:hypothetical protein